jgi:hypothetical protein
VSRFHARHDSETNHDETVAYFKEMKYFGLRNPIVLSFAEHDSFLDMEGKLVLQGPGAVFRNPTVTEEASPP